MAKLPMALAASWAPLLRAAPEAGMGYQTARVSLRDGRAGIRVLIDSGYITKAESFESAPFDAADIVSITVTNERWSEATSG